ncbi:MAG: hypothetical protein ACREEM_31935 [Blastocatellia bacterium]
MLIRIVSKFAFSFLVVAVLFTNVLVSSGAKPEPRQLVVHEWGTFTTVSTVDGSAQLWSPLLGPSELPKFVYRSNEIPQRYCGKCGLTLARMETPVLYFYADRKTDVSVKVDFPHGRITEWYPQARLDSSTIRWENFRVEPGAKEGFSTDHSKSHYYPARETDAAPIQLKTEQEKFLFYRGLGDITLPLSVKMAGGKVIVNSAGQEIAQVIVFEKRDGRAGWRIHGKLKGEAAIDRPASDQPLESLLCEIEGTLVAQGLYPKEAAAMVKTWRGSWFEEGLRVFYVLPRATTDAVLPISISPMPTELVRVMVTRAEIITPEMERTVLAAANQFNDPSPESRAAAIKTVRTYGRFAEPVLRGAMGRARTNEERNRIWELIQAASTG